MNIDEFEYDELEQKINKQGRQIKNTQLDQKAWTPNNFMKNKGVCIEDTLYPSEWVVPSNVANLGRDTSQNLFESGSIMFNTNAGTWNGITKAINYDFTNVNIIAFSIFVEEQYSLDNIKIRLSTTAGDVNNINGWSKYFESGVIYTSIKLHTGWNYIKIHKNDFTNVNAETWGTFRAIRIIANVPSFKFKNDYSALTTIPVTSTKIGIGGIYLNPTYDTPKLLLNFDDSMVSLYTKGFPYMRQKGVRGTVFLCRNHVADIGGVSFMTEQQHQEWYDAGNDIGTHSVTHQDMWLLNKEQLIAEYAPPIQYLLSKGWDRGAYILAFPQGKYNGIAMKVIKDLGVKFARGRNKGLIDHTTFDDILQIPTHEITGTTTLATITGYIDKAILYNSSVSIFTHSIVDSAPDAYSTTTAIFQAYIDYAVAKRDLGLLEIVTYSEFYNKLTDKTINIPNIIIS